MKTVQTVSGTISVEQLGFMQLHEHIFVDATPASKINPALCIDCEEKSILELEIFRLMGGCSILDAQPLGAGRNASALERISKESRINIVSVTGFHLPMFYSKNSGLLIGDEESILYRYLCDLDIGMDDTKIRAGAVKAAIPKEGAQGSTMVLLKAAAKAAALREVPLILHTEAGQNSLDAIDVILSLGVDKSKLVVCHADRQAIDYSIHEEIAKTGVFLEYDTIGRFKYHDDKSECKLILHMFECGYKSQLLLSLDTTASRLKSYGGEIGLDYLFTVFMPMLMSFGMKQVDITDIMTQNTKNVFL